LSFAFAARFLHSATRARRHSKPIFDFAHHARIQTSAAGPTKATTSAGFHNAPQQIDFSLQTEKFTVKHGASEANSAMRRKTEASEFSTARTSKSARSRRRIRTGPFFAFTRLFFAFAGLLFAFTRLFFAFAGLFFAFTRLFFAFTRLFFAFTRLFFAFAGLFFAFTRLFFVFAGLFFAFTRL